MKMKAPEMSVVRFGAEDILTTSGGIPCTMSELHVTVGENNSQSFFRLDNGQNITVDSMFTESGGKQYYTVYGFPGSPFQKEYNASHREFEGFYLGSQYYGNKINSMSDLTPGTYMIGVAFGGDLVSDGEVIQRFEFYSCGNSH